MLSIIKSFMLTAIWIVNGILVLPFFIALLLIYITMELVIILLYCASMVDPDTYIKLVDSLVYIYSFGSSALLWFVFCGDFDYHEGQKYIYDFIMDHCFNR